MRRDVKKMLQLRRITSPRGVGKGGKRNSVARVRKYAAAVSEQV